MIKQTLSLAELAIRSILTFHVKLCGYESGYVLADLIALAAGDCPGLVGSVLLKRHLQNLMSGSN